MTDPLEPGKDVGIAVAEQGKVVLDGPDGVAVTMTPETAEATAANLQAAVTEARRQSATVE